MNRIRMAVVAGAVGAVMSATVMGASVMGAGTAGAAASGAAHGKALSLTVNPRPVHETETSGVHARIDVLGDRSLAGDDVEIDSQQLQAACGGTITFTTPEGATSSDTIEVTLDGAGRATAAVEGGACQPGSYPVDASLRIAPFDSASAVIRVVTVRPPSHMSAVVQPNPVHQGPDHQIQATVAVRSPHALQPVTITSSQLSAACGGTITFTAPDGASAANSITVSVDVDYGVTVTVTGPDCAQGRYVVQAEMKNAPFTEALTHLVVRGPTH